MVLAETFFIYPHDDGLVLWNFGTHEQFSIDHDTVCGIEALARNPSAEGGLPPELIEVLTENRIVLERSPGAARWKWDVLSRIFHQGTKDIPITENPDGSPQEWVAEYLDYCDTIGPPPEAARFPNRVRRPLPEPQLGDLGGLPFLEVLRGRKTSRDFSGDPVSLTTVSTALFATLGRIHGDWKAEFDAAGLEVTARRRSSPSGGGLQAVRGYLVALEVDGLERGVYCYDDEVHELVEIAVGDLDPQLTDLLWGQYYVQGVAFGLFLTARFDLAAWKYAHSRAYRNVLLDAGHLSQTFLLTATALGLSTWLTGAFHDTAVEKLLEVDGSDEGVVFFVAAGHGSGAAFDAVMTDVVAARG